MKLLSLDIETSIGKGIHGGSFRDKENDFYTLIYGNHPKRIFVDHKDCGFKRELSEGCIELLEQSDVIVGHNLPFDLSYICNCSATKDFFKRGGITWDTQIAEYLLSGQRHAFSSLAELQLIYLNEKVKESRISRLFGKGIGADAILNSRIKNKRLFKLYEKYSHDDGSTTLMIALKQIELAKKLGMINIIKAYNSYMVGLVYTSQSGIKIDMVNCEKTLRAFRLKAIEYLQKAEEIVQNYWNDPHLPKFNMQSPPHKSALLFGGKIKNKIKEDDGFYKNGKPKSKTVEYIIDVKGFNIPVHFTEMTGVSGRYKTGEDFIYKISEANISEDVNKYCKLQKLSMGIKKMCSTYLEAFIKRSVDGYLYPHYNNCQTATGRLSSSKPNLQNIPSKGGVEKYIKNQFVAPEGYKCVSIDFSQLEIYVQAVITKDVALTNDLLSGMDFHILRLSYAEDMSYEDVYKLCKIDKLPEWELKRSKAKAISYQKAYGASPNSLSKSTGLDVEVIKKIFEKEDINYPGVKDFNDRVMSNVIENKHYSYAKHIPAARKGNKKESKKFFRGMELLPIVTNDGKIDYFDDEFRYIGYYRTNTGKCYVFEEFATYNRFNQLRRGFKPTQIKNYPYQGGAADVVAVVTAELFKYIQTLENDEVKMINQIHDSIEFYIKEDVLDLTISKLVSIMEDVPGLFKSYLNVDVPFKFKVDVKIGPNFYDLKEYKIEV